LVSLFNSEYKPGKEGKEQSLKLVHTKQAEQTRLVRVQLVSSHNNCFSTMAEAKIKNVLYDTLTDEVLLAFDKCVPSGEAWKDSLPPDSTFSGELSLIDAASCPSSLNKTTVEFNDYFRNKVVIFAGSPAPEEACTRDFFSFAGWTERLSRAGAAGVIHLSAAVGRVRTHADDCRCITCWLVSFFIAICDEFAFEFWRYMSE
jgi:hypothetical protein